MLFSFASEHTIVGVLLLKNNQNLEQPIPFYRKALRDATLKYNIMEKHAYALVKYLKDFRVYELHSRIIAYLPSNAIKDIFTQPNPEGRRDKWIVVLLENDLEIYPTKLIKGKGLAKMLAQSNSEVSGVNFLDSLLDNPVQDEVNQVNRDIYASPWFKEILYVLQKFIGSSRID